MFNPFKFFQKKLVDQLKLQKYAYCEGMFASSTSFWHIRKLSSKGRKPSGGADTLALCGHKVSWDLNISPDILTDRTCLACAKIYGEINE